MKPTEQETKVITIMLSIAFGVIIGLASTKEKIVELEEENNFLLHHVQELSELNEIIMSDAIEFHSNRNRVDRVTQPKNEN
tara:strand:- start:389 stop:631 length:243 start_codon:yes stop_codon:yes gene_type:complete